MVAVVVLSRDQEITQPLHLFTGRKPMLQFGAPGPLEIVIIASILLVTVLIPVGIVFGLLFTMRISDD